MLSPDGPGISSRNHLPFVRGIYGDCGSLIFWVSLSPFNNRNYKISENRQQGDPVSIIHNVLLSRFPLRLAGKTSE